MPRNEDIDIKDEPRKDEHDADHDDNDSDLSHDEQAAAILQRWSPRSEAVRRAMERSRKD
jgi:hypothetical protein